MTDMAIIGGHHRSTPSAGTIAAADVAPRRTAIGFLAFTRAGLRRPSRGFRVATLVLAALGLFPAGILLFTPDGTGFLQPADNLLSALFGAGAFTGMELDVHRRMVAFNIFTRDGGVAGHQLLPDMHTPTDRYPVADWRDFVMVSPR